MVQPLYNGNISQTFWRTANDNKLRGYAYSYDALNRLDTAYYRKGTTYSNNFNESLSYDKNGNILSLQRWGVPEDYGTVPAIPNMDDLSYTYFPNSNKLRKVTDATANPEGFNNGNSGTSDDYTYDPNANMKTDLNKSINYIKYNHLNLPTEITFSDNNKIEYIYNSSGQKISKTVHHNSEITTTEYLDGFQYIDEELQFFPIPIAIGKDYVRKTDGSNRKWFDYVYNYTDHLGNIRLSYTSDPLSSSTNNIKILEENNYNPFGLQHGSYNTPARDYRPIGDAREIETVDRNPYKYKYNGKELQDELNLNLYDYGARNYDAAIGRFFNMDRYAFEFMPISPYNYAANNPISNIDLNGDYIIIDQTNDDGNVMLSLLYENGKAYWYSKDKSGNITKGKEYDGKSSYISSTVKNINSIAKTNEGASLVSDLQNSTEELSIRDAGAANPYYGNNTVYYKDMGSSFTADGAKYPGPVALGHEMYHAWEDIVTEYGLGNSRGAAESRAVAFGNYLRANLYSDLKMRTRYSKSGSLFNIADFSVVGDKSYYLNNYKLPSPYKLNFNYELIGGPCKGCDNMQIQPIRYNSIPTMQSAGTISNMRSRQVKIEKFKSSLPK